MKTTINVTAEHIKLGKRTRCAYCPVALAAREATGCDIYVHIGSMHGYTKDRNRYWRVLPEIAKDFVAAYDAGLPVQPFSFELDLP